LAGGQLILPIKPGKIAKGGRLRG